MCRRLLVALCVVLMSVDVLAAERLASYRELPNGPLRFVHEQFGAELDPWQQDAMIAFASPRAEHRRIALLACAGPGKTAIESLCAWFFLATQYLEDGEHPKGLATSITGQNLRDNLWAELAKWQMRSPLLQSTFTWSANRIFQNDHPATWFLAQRAWPKTGSADQQGRTLAGLHSRSILFLIDESGAVPPTVLRAAEQGLANTAFGKVLQAGNPISLEGMLHEAANRLRDQWVVIRITGDPDDPKAWVHSPRVATVGEGEQSPADWAREQIKTYGRDNPWVLSYILGQFPPASINALLGLEEVERAMQRELVPSMFEHMQRRLGVDVARFGDDRTVLFPRQGLQAYNPVELRSMDGVDVAARIAVANARWPFEVAYIDDTGHWGHSVYDNLRRLRSLVAVPIQFHVPALDKRYRNRRTEMWIGMADAIKGGVSLPFNQSLIPELTTPTYTFVNGQLWLEEKDLIKKRLGRSPDIADALALTYATPDCPALDRRLTARHTSGGDAGYGRALTDYDPLTREGL